MMPRSANRITTRPALPPVHNWTGETLPYREIRAVGRTASLPADATAPPHLDTGPRDQPFDFGRHVRRLARDIARRCPELRHIDVGRILFTVTQARTGRKHGLQARVTPLRFDGGKLIRAHRGGRYYQVQRFRLDGRDMLYVMTFCLPRYLNLDFDDKLTTLFHELFHISPEFDGDLRRHEGRYHIHSHSQKEYDAQMAPLARAYLDRKPDPRLLAFLRLNFAQLRHRHGSIIGLYVPRPRLLPVRAPSEY